MTNLICTVLLYLAYFYSKSKFDLSPTMKYPTEIWEKRWTNPIGFVSKNEFSLVSLLILLTAEPKRKGRNLRTTLGENHLFSLHKMRSCEVSIWVVSSVVSGRKASNYLQKTPNNSFLATDKWTSKCSNWGIHIYEAYVSI